MAVQTQAGGFHGTLGPAKPGDPSGPLGGRMTTTRGPTISSFMLLRRLRSRSGRRLTLETLKVSSEYKLGMMSYSFCKQSKVFSR